MGCAGEQLVKSPNAKGQNKMIYIWVKYQGETKWEPHATFSDKDVNDRTTIATEAQFEITELRNDGHSAKKGKPF
jgi:hypothetical protein